MEVILKGEANEIAALVVALQEGRQPKSSGGTIGGWTINAGAMPQGAAEVTSQFQGTI